MLARNFHDKWSSSIPFILRIGVGLTFLFAGWPKLVNPPVQYFASLGIPAPEIMAPFIGVVEAVGGLLILLGLGTRLVSILLICDMLVAIFAAKMGGQQGLMTLGLPAGWNAVRIELMLLLGSLILLTTGPGRPSIEKNILKREIP
jgi:putative oxidoreductase